MVVSDSYEAQRTSVLVVDDDQKLCRLIKDYLEPLGYDVATANTGKEGLEKALSGRFDAVILDVMMPEMDGLEVLRRLRAASTIPVLMLTGLGEEADRIVGLELGADDYLPKTFSTRELLARLRAVIRRSRITQVAGKQAAPLIVGALWVDPETRTVALDGKPVPLTAVEFDILLCLTRNCGRIQSREHLLLEVAERDFE